MVAVQTNPLNARLVAVGPQMAEIVLKGVNRFNQRIPLDVRQAFSKRTIKSAIADLSYDVARVEVQTIPLDVRGRELDRYVEVLDGGAPLAAWLKAVKRGRLLSCNNWSSRRTRRMRRENRLNDRPGKPELVIFGYTLLIEAATRILTVEDIFFTREINITSDARERVVVPLLHVYNHLGGMVMIEPNANQMPLFSPAPTGSARVVVKVKSSRPAAASTTPVVGTEAARRKEEKKEAAEAQARRKEARPGA